MSGTARFYPWLDGTMVEIELSGMPARNEPFAVHIHEDAFCEPEENVDTPERCAATAKHSGYTITLPGVFSNNGYAYMATYTDRFIPQQAPPTASFQPIPSATASPAELYAEWKSANHFNFLRSFALISVRLILPLTVLGRESTNSITLGYL